MNDKSKTPAELNADDLDKVQGGYSKVEWTLKESEKGDGFTATDDLANRKKGWNIEQGSAWNIEQGSALKDAKDSGDGR